VVKQAENALEKGQETKKIIFIEETNARPVAFFWLP
jgi:hypothetical protein